MSRVSNAENDPEVEVPRPKCPQCGSTRNIGGRVNNEGDRHNSWPKGLRFLTFKTHVPVLEAFRACLDCGHLWSNVSPKDLESLVIEKGEDDAIQCMKR